MAKQGHNKKKPTKTQMKQNIVDTFQGELKKNFIKNMIVGFETANQMIIDKINDGATVEEVKEFCEKNVKNKETIENIVANK